MYTLLAYFCFAYLYSHPAYTRFAWNLEINKNPLILLYTPHILEQHYAWNDLVTWIDTLKIMIGGQAV